MSIEAPKVQCGDQSIHLPHMHWFNDGIGTPGFNPDRWGSYDRASCPGIDGHEVEREAAKADLEAKAEEIRTFLGVKPVDVVAAPQTEQELELALKGTTGRALFHARATAHVTAVIFRPVPTGIVVGWRCDYCLAGDE